MAISSAMYAAVTGLSALGTGMQTISNNIANVSTVGFKAGRTNYEDLISQNYFSGGKVNQRGTGVKVSTIQSMFTQGAFMTSAQDTDMAIAGEGFFSVRNAVTGAINYTRAGVYTLTKDGQMEDPSGNILQGWQMSIPKPGEEAVRIGMPVDVKITVLNAPPVASSVIKVVTNLNSEDDPRYLYHELELAHQYADAQAVGPAESARLSTIVNTYPTTDDPKVQYEHTNPANANDTKARPGKIKSSGDDVYDKSFLTVFDKMFSSAANITDLSQLKIVSDRIFDNPVSFGNTNINSASSSVTPPLTPPLSGPEQAAQNAWDQGFISMSQYEELKKMATGPLASIPGTIPAGAAAPAVPGDPNNVGHFTSASVADGAVGAGPVAGQNTWAVAEGSGNGLYDQYLMALYNKYHPSSLTGGATPPPGFNPINTIGELRIVDDSSVLTEAEYAKGYITKSEFDSLVVAARAEARAESMSRGRTAYNTLYKNIYDSTYNAITSRLNGWQLEGNGFAGAWNAQENPPISPENYAYPSTLTIYDSLGAEHKLNVYYQPNPHMENVWDYIITADPLEDARKDSNNNLLMSDTASFSGLIQKGKITFTADGPDRHGGMIKDIEAQNIDLSKTKMATIDPPDYDGNATNTMRNATIGGYYKGTSLINPYTGEHVSTPRTYKVTWGGNVLGDPPTSGMVWEDSDGNTGIIPVYDKQFAGPYEFGSGMTISFDTNDLPLRFGTSGLDAVEVTAHSEQIAWTNLEPNKEGYFDFDVAFVESASMALHPPYPAGMPTMTQHIAMDMGARNPFGLDTEWTLDEQSTTQYAGKSNTIFSNSDGYPMGNLQRVSIGEDGVVTGIFSNGRHQPLYQIGLTRFLNPWGLSKIGDNLFEETIYSGEGAMNEPGTAGNGTILGNFLEQSNVDVAEEIVNMIMTQRGFQANSKTVTTTDSMLAEVIEMKR